ncbi:hypothetical protein BLNAU_10349 [Blattamonas nauphoetae]|uniref:Uncharacterized protein n=1 Tax=Blattamonas nauphoetae TaxID=2049346 RepID=A0ABQ9XT79_9EUKA|nr:hypothetical protein BLNAU_10349 [Blattamonas nauphoetae]
MLPHTTQNSNTTPTPLLIKVLFVGDRKVGKSSIIRQCLTDEFYPTYNPSRDLNVHMGNLFRRPLDVTTPTEAPPKPLYPPKKVNKDWVDSSSDGDLPPPFTMDLSEQEKNDLNEEARSPGSFETSKRRILPPSDSVKRVAALLAGEKTATTNWLTGMSKEGVVRPSQHRSSRNSSVQTQSLSKSESPVQQSLSRSAQSTSDPPISSPAAIHIQPQSSAATLTRLQVSTPTPSPKPAITPKQTPTKASPVKGMSWMKGKNPSKSNPHQPSVQIREMHEQVLREREQKVREKERKIELREADVLAKEEVVNNEMMVCIRLKERIERKEQEEEKKAIKTVDEEEYRKVRTLLDTVVQEKDRLKAEVATLQAEKIEWMKERAFLKGQMEIGAHRPRGQPKQAETTQEQQLLKLLEVTRHELEHERKERQRDVERIRMETQMTYARELNLLIDSTQEIANKRKESIQQSMRPP